MKDEQRQKFFWLEPVFQFRSLGLADDDFLGHRHFQVNGQPPVEPQADVGYGLP